MYTTYTKNGFNPAFPIIVWKGQDIIVDGHNRYSICQKYGLPFEFVEQEFATRYDVINEMFKIQFDRRNMGNRTRTYLVGKRYLIEKTVQGGDRDQKPHFAVYAQNKNTAHKIAENLGINHATVNRAAEFTLAVDKIVQLTGIIVNDILNGEITDPMDKIKDLADKDSSIIVRIIDCVVVDKISVASATARIEKEDYNRQKKETEQKAKDDAERERIRKENKKVIKINI